MNEQHRSTIRRHGWKMIASASSFVIAFSALRGIRRGYEPIGDNALIELRGRDVLTGDHPFLGTWSSVSISAGVDVNHPGPLLFDLVAGPVRLLGGGAGIAVAIAALHIAVVWSVGVVTARVGGATSAIAAQAVTAGLVWTLGSELLYDPWQPNVLVLPFWLMICCVWAVVAGQVRFLPLAVGAASFVMQTHLSYILIAPMLLAFALGMAMFAHWRTGRTSALRRPIALSVVVGVVLWAQPLWEQFFGAGRGNISRVVIAGTGGGDEPQVESVRTGVSLGLRMLGAVLALPPWWGRPGYGDSIPGGTWVDTPSGREMVVPELRALTPSLVGLVAFAVVVAFAWRRMARIGASTVVAGFQTLAVAVGIAAVTVIITPIDVIGLSPHKVRWLWVIGAFMTYVLLMALLAGASTTARRGVLSASAAIAMVALVATMPTFVNPSGPAMQAAVYPALDDLRDQLDDYFESPTAPEEVVFDVAGMEFAEPYTAPVTAGLLAAGVDVYVEDYSLSRQLGEDRLGTAAANDRRSRLYVRIGPEAVAETDGVERIAFHDGERTPFGVVPIVDRAVAVFLVTPTDAEHS